MERDLYRELHVVAEGLAQVLEENKKLRALIATQAEMMQYNLERVTHLDRLVKELGGDSGTA